MIKNKKFKNNKYNLILSAAVGYNWNDLKIFVKSLRKISNEGKDILAHILKNNGIEEKRGVKDDSIPMFREIGYITSGCRSIGTGQNIGISFCSMYLLYETITSLNNGNKISIFS
mgnify:CR=1 FL=1